MRRNKVVPGSTSGRPRKLDLSHPGVRNAFNERKDVCYEMIRDSVIDDENKFNNKEGFEKFAMLMQNFGITMKDIVYYIKLYGGEKDLKLLERLMRVQARKDVYKTQNNYDNMTQLDLKTEDIDYCSIMAANLKLHDVKSIIFNKLIVRHADYPNYHSVLINRAKLILSDTKSTNDEKYNVAFFLLNVRNNIAFSGDRCDLSIDELKKCMDVVSKRTISKLDISHLNEVLHANDVNNFTTQVENPMRLNVSKANTISDVRKIMMVFNNSNNIQLAESDYFSLIKIAIKNNDLQATNMIMGHMGQANQINAFYDMTNGDNIINADLRIVRNIESHISPHNSRLLEDRYRSLINGYIHAEPVDPNKLKKIVDILMTGNLKHKQDIIKDACDYAKTIGKRDVKEYIKSIKKQHSISCLGF